MSDAIVPARRGVPAGRHPAVPALAGPERPALLEQLRQTSLALTADFHETIRRLIERQSSGPLQAAYFRRLEGAASESDLHQLLADLQQLDQWGESDDEATGPDSR